MGTVDRQARKLVIQAQKIGEAIPTNWPYGADMSAYRFVLYTSLNAPHHILVCALAHCMHKRGAMVELNNAQRKHDIRTVPSIVVEHVRDGAWRVIKVIDVEPGDDFLPVELLDVTGALAPVELLGYASDLMTAEDNRAAADTAAKEKAAAEKETLATLMAALDKPGASADDVKKAVKAALQKMTGQEVSVDKITVIE